MRNKLRSSLTILSIAFSLALMTILHGYMAMQDQLGFRSVEASSHRGHEHHGFAGDVPIANVDRVRGMEGVLAAVPYSWFGGMYKDQQMAFAQFATDPKEVFKVWPEYKIAPEQLKEFQSDRQACVADRQLAERMKWKVGERIPLQGTFYPVSLDLKLVGLFDAPQNTDSLWFDWTYLDEGLRATSSEGSGNAGTIFAKTVDPGSMATVCKAIDERFASSDNPTRSQTESAFAQMFADMVGNIQLYILVIGIAVVFSLTLVAATAMAMSMRERTTEVAVLKAIGFSKTASTLDGSGRVVLDRRDWRCAWDCVWRIVFARVAYDQRAVLPFSIFEMAGAWMLLLLLVAAGIGLISGIIPAVRAAQLSVIDGLRRVV